jgi:integrase
VSEGVYRKCHCRGPSTVVTGPDGRQRTKSGPLLAKNCPELARNPKHGSWYGRYEAPPGPEGKRRQVWTKPYKTAKEAEKARREALSEKDSGACADDKAAFVGDYLGRWLEWKIATALKPSTADSYREAIELYYKPGIGHLKLGEIRQSHLQRLYGAMRKLNRAEDDGGEMLRRLIQARATWHGQRISGRPLSDARIRRVHAVLRAACNDASIPDNPAARLKMGKFRKSRPMLWTAPRVERWLETGERPAKVMVWTREQCQAMLDFIEASGFRLYAMYLVAARYGPRRSELAGLMRAELDLSRRRMHIRLAQVVDKLDSTKSEDSDRIVTIDADTAAALAALRKQQAAEQLAWGPAHADSGRVFSREDGSALRPEWISERFDAFIRAYEHIQQSASDRPDVAALARRHRVTEEAVRVALAGPPVPPVRLHDLRHGAATMLRAAKVDIKTISAILGHATVSFTDDVYVEVAEEMAESAASAIEAYLPRRGSNVTAGS